VGCGVANTVVVVKGCETSGHCFGCLGDKTASSTPFISGLVVWATDNIISVGLLLYRLKSLSPSAFDDDIITFSLILLYVYFCRWVLLQSLG
jgi:hypothetical protein